MLKKLRRIVLFWRYDEYGLLPKYTKNYKLRHQQAIKRLKEIYSK